MFHLVKSLGLRCISEGAEEANTGGNVIQSSETDGSYLLKGCLAHNEMEIL